MEADDQQVNLSRFSLFFPEKRQFFQERSGIFAFNFIGRDRLFHSRQIGIQDRERVSIIGGARLVGRVGNWDLGFLDMQTARKRDIPRENFGVLRLRRQVINPDSYAGIILTNRIDEEGNYNFAYGLDGIFRLFGKEYLTLYNFHEGNDLWLVYNEDINTDRDYDIPRELLTRGRTVLLKYTNTFGI